MTWCDWCSKQLAVNRKQSAQRNQPKIMKEVKIKERNRKKKHRAGLRVICVSSVLTSSLSSSTQSLNNPLPPQKENLKAFFWKKSSLLRLLLFTFGKTAIGGRVQTQEKAFGYRKSCRRPGRLAEMLRLYLSPPVRSPGTWRWDLASTSGNQPSTISSTVPTLPFTWGYWS